MNLDALYTHDLSDEIASLPRKPGARTHAARPVVRSNTLHYSGVAYKDRSEAAELAHILAEAREHLKRNWGKAGEPPIYGSDYMYDLVVLSSGGIVRLRRRPVQLWHAGNATANRESFSGHVLLGKNQAMTPPQRESLFRVFDVLGVPVFGHCEWPRGTGAAQPSDVYRLLPGQSECPNTILHTDLVLYRRRLVRPTPPVDVPLPPDVWPLWGNSFPLPVEQRGWGIPQLWKENAKWMGAARSSEIALDDDTAIQSFTGGWIVFKRSAGVAQVYKRF